MNEKIKIINEFITKILQQDPIPEGIDNLVNENIWDLLSNDEDPNDL